jgi:hypothetical protein
MKTHIYTPAEAINAAQAEGCIEISSGVYLNSQENIVAEQQVWSDEDSAKHVDFSKAAFWITTDDGVVQPIHGENDDDLINALANV